MSPIDVVRFDELCSRYLDSSLSVEEQRELLRLLDDRVLAKRFRELITLDHEIGGLLATPISSETMVTLVSQQITQGVADDAVMQRIRNAVEHSFGPKAGRSFRWDITWISERLGMHRWKVVAVCAGLLILLGVSAFFPGTKQGSWIARIEFVQGDACLSGPFPQVHVRVGAPLFEGAGVETLGGDSAAGLRYRDGTLVVLYAKTRISGLSAGREPAAGSSGEGKSLYLQSGSLTAQVTHQPPRLPLLVKTHSAEAKVLGTTLNLDTSPDQTRLEVLKGRVELVRNEDGASVQTAAGYSSTVSEGTDLTVHRLIPLPWISQDIGNSLVAGSARCEDGKFTVRGSGDDIWENADSFQFVHQPRNGDCEIVVRLTEEEITGSHAKAGVMVRETMEPGSRDVVLNFNPANMDICFYHRAVSGGISKSAPAVPAKIPCWLKLVRRSNDFSAYLSGDGLNWELIGTQTVSMAPSVHVGMAVSSFNNGVLNTSSFDHVSVR